MRHNKKRLQLNRFTSWRKATLVSLTRNLLTHQSIKTTQTKATAVQPLIEKLITLTKENTLAGKRRAFKILGDHRLVRLLFNEIGPRFTNRNSGYTRIFNLARRRGDNASMVILELTEIKEKEQKKPKKEIKEEEKKPEITKGKISEEKKPTTEVAVKERPPITKKPTRSFLGGIRSIFKKERDSL